MVSNQPSNSYPSQSDNEVERIKASNGITTWIVCGTRFDIDSRYEIVDPMGQGAFGVVVAARDTLAEDPNDNLVAIKKIE